MVRAILTGTKTQTRRAIKTHRSDDSFVCVDHGAGWWPYRSEDGESDVMSDGCEYPYTCPYGVPGDRLWVRETWRHTGDSLEDSRAITECAMSGSAVDWRATYIGECMKEIGCTYEEAVSLDNNETWRPSIHMPRWASRITLEITDVRVERLQEISQADAIAEGAPPSHPSIDVVSREFGYEDFSRSWYAQLWEHINGPGSWDANPWVWCVSFRRLT